MCSLVIHDAAAKSIEELFTLYRALPVEAVEDLGELMGGRDRRVAQEEDRQGVPGATDSRDRA